MATGYEDGTPLAEAEISTLERALKLAREAANVWVRHQVLLASPAPFTGKNTAKCSFCDHT